jgi:hypothetical protein
MLCPSTIKGCSGCLEASVFFCIWAVWVRKWYVHFSYQVCHYSMLKYNMVSQFYIVKDTCNVTSQELGALNLWVTAAASLEHVLVSFCQGWELVRFRFDSSLTDHLFQADTITTVFIVLFDTLVVVVTLYNTLGLVRCSREFQTLPRRSLTQTLAEQGRLIHPYTFKCPIDSLGHIRYGSVIFDHHRWNLHRI